MTDWLFFIGGIIFIILSGLAFFRRDLVWRLYSLEPRWRRDNPERTPEWDERTKRSSIVFLGIGLIFTVLGL